jgi:hypothetical protein
MHTDCFRAWDLTPWTAEQYDREFLHPMLRERPHAIGFLRHLRRYLVRAPKGVLRAFKETTLFEKLPWLDRYLPGVRIVLLVRDPRAVVYSVLRRRMQEFFGYRDALRRWSAEIGAEVDGLSPVALVAHSWRLRMRLAHQYLSKREHLVVRLEDVFGPPRKGLANLMNFIGTAVDERQVEFLEYAAQTSGQQYSTRRCYRDVVDLWRNALSQSDIEEVENIVAPEMRSFGYR